MMFNRSQAIDFILSIYQTLQRQDQLSPENETVTKCLNEFVGFLSVVYQESWAADLPDAPELVEVAANLPVLCGIAECKMEKWWCRHFLSKRGLTYADLASFQYFDSYRSLIEGEVYLLGTAIRDCVIFLGSGALPLTAIVLAELIPNFRIRCIDKDAEACALASALIRRLGLDGGIDIERGMAEEVDFQPEEAVVCASLLNAPSIYSVLEKRLVRTVIVRDAEGVFRFCYREARRPPETYRASSQTSCSSSRINISRLYILR